MINRFYRGEQKTDVVYCVLFDCGVCSIRVIFHAISYIRFVVEFKGVRNRLLEISTVQSELSSIYEFIFGYSLR